MNENPRIDYRRQLKLYIYWPMILSGLSIALACVLFFINMRAAIVASCFAAVHTVIALMVRFANKKAITTDMVNFAVEYGQVQKQLLKGLPLPYAILDDDARFIWANKEFKSVLGMSDLFGKSIASHIPSITKDSFPENDSICSVDFSIEERDYHASLQRIPLDEMVRESQIINSENFSGQLITVLLFDETEMNRIIRQNEEEKQVSGYIYMDNYYEVMENVEDVRRSLLSALIDRKIKKYFSSYDAVVKSFEKDKFFISMTKKSFDRLCENKFDILEDVKTVKVGNDMSVTLSMGFGTGASTLLESEQFARRAIDLALGRGGDQVVIRDPNETTYFGGKSLQLEKSTRVKARVKAHALREIIESHERIFVMGHENTDIDSFGAAIGVYRAVRQFDKKCHIVINNVTPSIKPFVDALINDEEYEPDIFASSSDAIQLADHSSVLVVVDTNKPSITECPELLSKCGTIVVLDHHRQGNETIENATLSYIEPYASSACEMIAEILQYILDGKRIKNIEADTIYAGIMIDTNNFMSKTGVRTFEAAAFLRRNGADITRVRKLFRNDLKDYKARAETVKNSDLFHGKYAIAVCPAQGLDSPTVVGAQAANELLNINHVTASFVLTQYQNRIYISARSIDEVNVQMIMERMGGGGHMNIAGTQLSDMSMEEARNLLEETIEKMEQEESI
ncbi:MAG: DHH family phosphoesterase [Lachnospiraceae bacterium]|nr:DHH family phosphoesterase [Lachnospiraceae bacterium]